MTVLYIDLATWTTSTAVPTVHPHRQLIPDSYSDTALKRYHSYFNQMQRTDVCDKINRCCTWLCCVYTCGHESSQGGF